MTTPQPRPQQLRLREHQVFLILSIVVGILAGLSAVLFTVAIQQTTHRLFGLAPSRARLLMTPALVSLITGLLLAKFFPDVRGSGVPQTEAAYHLSRGIIPWRVPFGKFLTGVLCIGSGHSMGREGPSVQIGAGIASGIAQWIGLSPRRTRDLIPVGAAGALAAAFNTPVAAVLFALEEIIGDMNATLIGSAVVASVASVVVERSILGNQPLFHVPAYHLVHPAELAVYAVMGVIGGLISLIFCKSLLRLRALFQRLPAATKIFQPAMGGIVIGVVLIFAPAIMGVGYDYVDQALNGGLLLKTMAALCVLKLVATVVSYVSGNAGGIFAPSLYIGAMAGGTIGMLVKTFAPFPTAEPGAYALVGMGTLFAGIIRAPMTSVFMIFEITQDYQILVPLMVANMLSFIISRRYQPVPVYHALLQQDGIHLPSPATQIGGTRRTARHVMQTEIALLSPDSTIDQVWKQVESDAAPRYLVGADHHIVGFVTAEDLSKARQSGQGERSLWTVVHHDFVHAHPDHSLDIVVDRLGQSDGMLPVVSRTDVGRLEGVVTIDGLLRRTEPARSGANKSTDVSGRQAAANSGNGGRSE